MNRGGLYIPQYVSREGHSTIDAINHIRSLAEEERRKTLETRKLCTGILIDIRNAFGSLPWVEVVQALEKHKVNTNSVRGKDLSAVNFSSFLESVSSYSALPTISEVICFDTYIGTHIVTI